MMWPLMSVVLFVLGVATLRGLRLRPWVIGISVLIIGLATHIAFEVWVADWAARFEMGLFAIYEAMLFLAGLGCVVVSLLGPWPPDVEFEAKVTAWLIWLAAAFAAALAVLARLPP